MLYVGVSMKAGNCGHDTQNRSIQALHIIGHMLGLHEKHKDDESSGTRKRYSQQGMDQGRWILPLGIEISDGKPFNGERNPCSWSAARAGLAIYEV